MLRSTEVMLMVMATSMALPLPALWSGAIDREDLTVVGHVLMLLLMLAEMLLHREEESGHHRSDLPRARLGPHPRHPEEQPERAVGGHLEPPVPTIHLHHPR